MKTLRLFLLTILLTNFPNFLNSMESDNQQTDDDDIETADKSDEDTKKEKEKVDVKVDSSADEDNLEQDMANLDIKNSTAQESSSSQEPPKKRALKLTNKSKNLWRDQKQITKQIAKEKTEVLHLPGIKPQKIPTYLLEILLDRKTPLRCIDITPKQTKALDGNTTSSIIDVIKTLFEKIASALKSKADKELIKIKIAVDEDAIKKLTDDDFLKLPIQVDRKDLEKFKEDPNISSIKFGNFTIYIIPEECKSGWNTAGKVFAVLGYPLSIVSGALAIFYKVNCDCSASSNSTTTIPPTTPAGTLGYYY